MNDSPRYRLRGAPVIHDTIDNETIAINQLSGAYYSLEGPAALAWQALADGASRPAIETTILAAYDADPAALAAAVQSFIDELLAEELIVTEPAGETQPGSPAVPIPDGPRHQFAGLSLQRYTDLEMLLLADPIHEVDDTCWPKSVSDKP
jgi:hypothetical protein